jgi:Uma2 family endonuclease
MAESKIRLTVEEFKQLPESNRLMELINGEIVMPPSPLASHQDLLLNTAIFLRQHIPNGKVVVAPMDVYLDQLNAFQPDVFWIGNESNCLLREGYYYGAPDLVVEILSPSTATQDRREKFEVYQKEGVLEYWMIDQFALSIEVWQRKDKKFHRLGIFEEAQSFKSNALQKELIIRGIFPKTEDS